MKNDFQMVQKQATDISPKGLFMGYEINISSFKI